MKHRPSRKNWFALALLVLLIAIGAALAIYYGTRTTERKAPQLLQQPTRARQVRQLHPGPEAGIPPPRIHPEKHAEGD
jgi:hypothetical protein